MPFHEGLIVLINSWENIVEKKIIEKRNDESSKNYIQETLAIRNKYYGHGLDEDIPLDELFRIIDTFYRFAKVIDATEILDEINIARKELGANLFSPQILEVPSGKVVPIQSSNEIGASNQEKKSKRKRFQGKGYSVEVEILGEVPDNGKVLSIPAGSTHELIQEYKIYSCPHEDARYVFKPVKYITFRNAQGEMDSIYQIEKILIIYDLEKKLELSKIGSKEVYELIRKVLKNEKEVTSREMERLKKYCTHDEFRAFFTFYNNSNSFTSSRDQM